MMIAVMDTNVLVSGLLSPHSESARLVRLVAQGSIGLAFDHRILSEYREVLVRPKFPFHPDRIDAFLTEIEEEGLKIEPEPIASKLPDPDDLPFLEVAVSARVDCIVTGNKKHFPTRLCRGIRVLSPKECLELMSRSKE